ncbi:MAG TPA: hypothetical protein VF178_05065 [Gemmatimonadaceae bacterium]
MSALTRFFFRHEVSCRTPAEVIAWWEARRLPYNLAVGSAGVTTLALVHLLFRLPPYAESVPLLPTLAVAGVYGIMANICYTGGWIAELVIRRTGGYELEPVGPALFRYGFAFSIGLTLFPGMLAILAYGARLALGLFGL